MAHALYIVGAGGFGREVHEYALDARVAAGGAPIWVAGFVDDNLDALHGHDLRARVVARVDDVAPEKDDRFVIAVGDPRLRKQLHLRLAATGARFASIVHPTAYVARETTIGEGVVVGPLSYVGPGARLDDHVAVNPQCAVAHDVQVGDYTVFSPMSAANGDVVLEEGAFLGTAAAILPRLRVGAWAYVGAGAVVRHDVLPGAKLVGVPARTIGRMEPG
jgi:sugar O-acyltransferase (sialic acid O-acetyltransferase NeuD family)